MRTQVTQARPRLQPVRSGFWPKAVAALALVGWLTGCQARRVSTDSLPVVAEPALAPSPSGLQQIVTPTRAVTNELKQVTYTFQLPGPPARGYIIQESLDGVTWTEVGRSTSTRFTRITFMDGTPSSGKQYRVALP